MEAKDTKIIIGLTIEEVEERKRKNLVNYDTSVPTKSIKRILLENFFTLFNFLNLFLAVAIFLVGSYKNMLFLGIVIINTAISTFQEIHSKRIVDKLSVMASSKARVIRNGKKQEISINDLVLDDVVEFNTGNQVATDCKILQGEVQVNESFLTGEPDTILKKEGEELLSGSYIVSGKCIAKVDHIGEENYTAKISSGAKYVKKINSEIMTSLNKIIRILTFAIIPIGIALFYTQLHLQGASMQDAVIKSVAAIIGMIPEGLVLLTSTVLAVSVIRLSKSKVLVQELYCIETLARVDTLCLDKTGTLTEGIMEVKDFVPVNTSQEKMSNILSNIGKFSEDENSTIEAIRDYFRETKNEFKPTQKVAFSSKTKWSGIYFEDEGSYIIGAPEFVLRDKFDKYKNMIEKYAKDYRVIVLANSKENFIKNELPDNVELIGFVLILDKIRKEAKNTLEYFERQGVDVKIISGDNPITVSKIAKQVGIKEYNNYIDMSTLKSDKEVKEAALKYTIFGRVSPTQKKALVLALQEKEKTDTIAQIMAYLGIEVGMEIFDFGGLRRKPSMIPGFGSEYDGTDEEKQKYADYVEMVATIARIQMLETYFKTFDGVILLPLAAQNESSISDSDITISIQIENSTAEAIYPTAELICDDLKGVEGYVYEEGLVEMALAQNNTVDIKNSRDDRLWGMEDQRGEMDAMLRSGINGQPRYTEEDYVRELSRYIASPEAGNSEVYSFHIPSLHAKESKWLSRMIILRPLKDTIQLSYSIKSSSSNGDLAGTLELTV